MFAKIRAVSAEGRLSGIFIGMMPLVVFGAVSFLNPGYFAEVYPDPLFLPLMGIAGGLLVLGQAIIWKMVNFKF
jgi:tight adherence protein B